MKRTMWIIFVILAILVGVYPLIYFLIDRKFGLLGTKPAIILSNVMWNIGFYTHIILGGVSLLIGWIQFGSSFRNKHLNLHKRIGKLYITTALLSSLAGIGIGLFATGGFLSALGFICLGIIWFCSTFLSYLKIKKGDVARHQQLMIFSYAACFSAVTLRIWLPLLTMITKDFITAYTIVAWLAWVPNILVASWMAKRTTATNQMLAE